MRQRLESLATRSIGSRGRRSVPAQDEPSLELRIHSALRFGEWDLTSIQRPLLSPGPAHHRIADRRWEARLERGPMNRALQLSEHRVLAPMGFLKVAGAKALDPSRRPSADCREIGTLSRAYQPCRRFLRWRNGFIEAPVMGVTNRYTSPVHGGA